MKKIKIIVLVGFLIFFLLLLIKIFLFPELSHIKRGFSFAKKIAKEEERKQTKASQFKNKLKKEFESYVQKCGKGLENRADVVKHKRKFYSCMLAELEKKEFPLYNEFHFSRFTKFALEHCDMPYVRLIYYKRKVLSLENNINKNEFRDTLWDFKDKIIVTLLSLGLFDEANTLIQAQLNEVKDYSLKKENSVTSDTVKTEEQFLIKLQTALAKKEVDKFAFITEELKFALKLSTLSDSDIIKNFANHKTQFLKTDRYGLTPFHYLISLERQQPVLSILKNQSVKFQEETFPILLFAVLTHSNKLVEYLLKEKPEYIETDLMGFNWIDYAIFYDNDEILKNNAELVKNYINLKDKSGNTPIFYAVQFFKNHYVESFIKQGAKLDIKNNAGYSLLDYAIISANTFAVKKLGECNIFPTHSGIEKLFPFIICKKNLCDLLDYFSEKNIVLPKDYLLMALNCAVENNEIEMARCILKFDIDLSQKFANGETIFFRIKSPEMAEILLQKTQNPEVLLVTDDEFYPYEMVECHNKKAAETIAQYMKQHGIFETMTTKIKERNSQKAQKGKSIKSL